MNKNALMQKKTPEKMITLLELPQYQREGSPQAVVLSNVILTIKSVSYQISILTVLLKAPIETPLFFDHQ